MSDERNRPLIDRSNPSIRDDPVLSRLTDEGARALLDVLVQLARSYAVRIEQRAAAEGISPLEIMRRDATRD